MKSAAVAQKEQMKALDMGQLEDLMDDMADIMADQEEINEMMGQNFAVEFDEDELMGELAELDEMAVQEQLDEGLGMPDYVIKNQNPGNSVPAQPNAAVANPANKEDDDLANMMKI